MVRTKTAKKRPASKSKKHKQNSKVLKKKVAQRPTSPKKRSGPRMKSPELFRGSDIAAGPALEAASVGSVMVESTYFGAFFGAFTDLQDQVIESVGPHPVNPIILVDTFDVGDASKPHKMHRPSSESSRFIVGGIISSPRLNPNASVDGYAQLLAPYVVTSPPLPGPPGARVTREIFCTHGVRIKIDEVPPGKKITLVH
jgi:hypothetical protein